MKKLTAFAKLLGEENEKCFKDEVTNILINRVREEVDAISLSDFRLRAECVKDKYILGYITFGEALEELGKFLEEEIVNRRSTKKSQ